MVTRLLFACRAALTFFFLLCLCTGCRGQSRTLYRADAVSGERALAEVRALVKIVPRDSGTEGASRAADHLAARLKDAGLEVEIDAFGDMTPAGVVTFRNVMGRIPGTGGGLIILGSHYDTKSGIRADFEGANDSGSSSGLLVELASVLKKGKRVGPDILIVFFDGEECMRSYGPYDGFHGSRHLARKLVKNGRADDVVAVLILDMIGDRDLNAWLPSNNTKHLSDLIMAAAKEEGVEDKFSVVDLPVGDDHVAFVQSGMPAADIIDFQFGSAPGLNDYWHTPKDTMDKISAESLETVGRVTIRVVNTLASRR